MQKFHNGFWALVLLHPMSLAQFSNLPTGPTLISPQASEVLDNGCTNQKDDKTWKFGWSPVANATAYHLYVIAGNAGIPAIDNPNLTTTEYVDQRIAYVADINLRGWRWKVRAKVNGVWGSWSEEKVFDVEPLNTDCSQLTQSISQPAAQPQPTPVQTVLPLNQSRSPVAATDPRKAEADRLLLLGRTEFLQAQLSLAPSAQQSPPSPQNLARSLTLYQELQDEVGATEARHYLTFLFLMRKEYDKAIELAQQKLAMVQQQSRNSAQEADGLVLLGRIYFMAGNYPQATRYYQQGLAINKTLSDFLAPQREIDALNTFAFIALAQQNYPQAIEHFKKVIEASKNWQLVQQPGSFSQPSYKGTYAPLGYALYQAGRLPEAQEVWLEWVKFRNTMTYSPLASLQTTPSNSLDALNILLAHNSRGIKDLLELLLITSGKQEQALEVSEQSRAHVLADLLNRRHLGKVTSNPFSTIGTSCTNGVCKITQTPATVTASDLPGDPPIDLKGIQQVAKQRQATLVQYSILRPVVDTNLLPGPATDLLIYVVQPSGKVTLRRVDLKRLTQQKTSLAQLVAQGQAAIGVRGAGFQEEAAVANEPFPKFKNADLQTLHQLLIEPIIDLLPKDPQQHVILVPQEELFLVPFAALQDSAGNYLIEKHTLLTTPSIQVLTLTEKLRQKIQHSSAKEILIVGNPTMPRIALTPKAEAKQLTQLPGAEKEAIAIGKLLQVSPLLGGKATKATILQQIDQARIIHLATHGLLYNTTASGIPGVIALAPTEQDQGLLTADEIFNLKLKAEMVVLSACDTGGGWMTGDGMVGLSRSLMAAGVPSIVVSLWQVPDGPTAALMTQFYQNLQQNPDKAQALRQAMLTTMKQYPDPKAWAAFTLIGEAL